MPKTKVLYSHFADDELFTLVKGNDLTAFEELYKRYWPVLVNAAFKRLSSRQKSEDIVQNIFVDLYQRRDGITLTYSLQAYLNQALKFKVLNEFRSEDIRIKYQRSLFFGDYSKNDLAEALEAKELELKINKVLDELPDKCRQVFLKSRREEMSNNEISADMNISVSTVEKHISKALKTFRCKVLTADS